MIKLQIWTFQEFSVICCRMICQDRWCASKVKHNSRLFCGLWCQHREWTQCCNSRRSMVLSMSRRLLLYFSSFCCWSFSTHQLFSDKLLQTKDADLWNEEWNHVRFIESFTTEDESTREKEAGQIWTNVVIVCKVTVSSSTWKYLNTHGITHTDKSDQRGHRLQGHILIGLFLEIQLLEYTIPPRDRACHENPDCNISETKRAIRNPLVKKRPGRKSEYENRIIIIKKLNLKNISNALSDHCTVAWVTRPQRLGVKDVIKQARRVAT